MPLDSKARRPMLILVNHIKAQVVVSPTWRRLCRVCYKQWCLYDLILHGALIWPHINTVARCPGSLSRHSRHSRRCHSKQLSLLPK